MQKVIILILSQNNQQVIQSEINLIKNLSIIKYK